MSIDTNYVHLSNHKMKNTFSSVLEICHSSHSRIQQTQTKTMPPPPPSNNHHFPTNHHTTKSQLKVNSSANIKSTNKSISHFKRAKNRTEHASQKQNSLNFSSSAKVGRSWEGSERVQKCKKEHTTAGIRWWSPTQLLIYRSEAYVWQSGRDAQFSSVYGRM